jgi:hypothetical protein
MRWPFVRQMVPVLRQQPGRVGDSYIDTANKRSYRAFGTGNASDWLSDQAITGSGAPAAAGTDGDRYIDITNKVSYTATGTASVSDWNQGKRVSGLDRL